MENILIVKIGGNVLDNHHKCAHFLKLFAHISQPKILVHGGGKMASDLSEKIGVEPKMIEGRRVTDHITLDIVTMVYAGLINKNIVAKLQAENCNAIGLCGADNNLILAHKRVHPTIDYGYVGDIDEVNSDFLMELLAAQKTPVLAPITHDKKGNLLNTNADTLAAQVAIALPSKTKITLIYAFEKNGLLENMNDENSVLTHVKSGEIQQLKNKHIISGGMVPKVDNIVHVLNSGVEKVILCKAENIHEVIKGNPIFGTTFTL